MGEARAWNKSLFVAQLGLKLAGGDGMFLRDFLVKRPCRVLIAQGEVTRYQSWVRWHLLTNGEGAPDGVDETYDRWKIRTIRKRRRDPVEDCYEEWPEAVLDPRLEGTIGGGAYDVLARGRPTTPAPKTRTTKPKPCSTSSPESPTPTAPPSGSTTTSPSAA
jgi:hypothetical protein